MKELDVPVISASREVLEEKYICDSCRRNFYGSNIVLHKKTDGFDIINPLIPPKFVNEKGRIISCASTIGNGTLFTMHCPHCDAVHLFGFDIGK